MLSSGGIGCDVRVVLDTNVLVGDAYAEGSASARIVEACLDGWLEPVISPQLCDEYERILPRAIRMPHWRERYDRLLGRAILVEPPSVPRLIVDDPSDDMLVATALTGQARALITNDRHLLGLGAERWIWIARPGEFVEACLS